MDGKEREPMKSKIIDFPFSRPRHSADFFFETEQYSLSSLASVRVHILISVFFRPFQILPRRLERCTSPTFFAGYVPEIHLFRL